MLSGLLKDPAQDADDRAAFQAYLSELTARWWPRMGFLIAAACVIWWPLDAWVYPNSRLAQDALGTLRAQLMVLDPLCALFPYFSPLARRHVKLGASFSVVLNLMLAGWCLAQLDGGGVLGIAYAYLLPQFSVLLLVPFGARILHLLIWSVALWATWLAHPATSFATPGALASLSYFAFSAVLGLFVGHAVYALLQRNFHLSLQVERQRTALETVAEHLETRVAEQTVAIRDLSARARDVRTAQRRELARDMHDHIGQELLSLRLLVGVGQQLHRDSDVARTFGELDGQVGRVQHSLRRVLQSLRPARLDELGLIEGLTDLMGDLERRSGLRFTLEAHGMPEPVPTAQALALYRVAQEAFNNVLRHARARAVRVLLSGDANALHMTIVDDGIGVRPSGGAPTGGLGMVGIRERVAELHGTARWTRTTEAGAPPWPSPSPWSLPHDHHPHRRRPPHRPAGTASPARSPARSERRR